MTMRTRHRRPTIRGTARTVLGVAVAAATALTAGCVGAAGGTSPSTVTVTSTVATAHSGIQAAGGVTARAPVSTRPGRTSDRRTSTSPAGGAAATSSMQRPPASITVSSPATPEPDGPVESAAGGPTDRSPGGTAADTTTGSPQPTTAAATAPGTPSLGDLFAAAARDAAAAGEAPADPDAPGPDSGPACSANTAYFDEAPTGLRADVISGWQQAAKAAATDGVTLCLNDGKRSRAQQQAQFDDYAELYGEQVAAQLVLPPDKSAHVVGIAIDVQPATGYRWLQATGGALGFCRMYDNEPWHFEFNPAYRQTGCPDRLAEPPR